MQYASLKQRTLAFIYDTILFVAVYTIFFRIAFNMAPDHEPPPMAMQLFTKKQMTGFVMGVSFTVIFIALYQIILPLTKIRGTLGTRLAGFKILRPQGQPVGLRAVFVRLFQSTSKVAAILFIGPVLSLVTDRIGVSWVGLLIPVGAYLAISIKSALSPEGAFWFEKLGNYRYVQTGFEVPGGGIAPELSAQEKLENI